MELVVHAVKLCRYIVKLEKDPTNEYGREQHITTATAQPSKRRLDQKSRGPWHHPKPLEASSAERSQSKSSSSSTLPTPSENPALRQLRAEL